MSAPIRCAALLALLLLGLPGCTVVNTRFGGPVPLDLELAQLTPGVTTRAEAVVLLGPPEEYRTPREVDRSRAEQVHRVQVVEERELLHRHRLTWIQERISSRSLVLLPILRLFRSSWRIHAADRIVVIFDDEDRVEHVAVTRELSS